MNADKIHKIEIEKQNKLPSTVGLLKGDDTIRILLESLAEGVIIVNERGRIVLINNKLAELTGYDKDEVVGLDMNIFLLEDIHKLHNNHINNYFKKPKVRPMGMEMELTAKRKDNSTFPVEISLSFLDTESGRLGLGFITDITSRKKIEDELKLRNIELDAYAHSVAHDLNTSLIGVVNYSELLIGSKDFMSLEKQEFFLKEIAQGGRKMIDIVREMLIFASMKKEEVDYSLFNMQEVIESALKRLRFQITDDSAQIRFKRPFINCLSYAPWIEEVWLNYISNAIKYGGKPPIIELSSIKTDDGYIKYSVSDNGEGIEDELMKIIFNENDKTKNRISKGNGLGLSIVKRIVDKLDGKVSVETNKKEGSVFSFYIKEA